MLNAHIRTYIYLCMWFTEYRMWQIRKCIIRFHSYRSLIHSHLPSSIQTHQFKMYENKLYAGLQYDSPCVCVRALTRNYNMYCRLHHHRCSSNRNLLYECLHVENKRLNWISVLCALHFVAFQYFMVVHWCLQSTVRHNIINIAQPSCIFNTHTCYVFWSHFSSLVFG